MINLKSEEEYYTNNSDALVNIKSIIASLLFHLILVAVSAWGLKQTVSSKAGFTFKDFNTFSFQAVNEFTDENISDKKNPISNDNPSDNNPSNPSPNSQKGNTLFNSADTSMLNQIYSETTLNVKIKYPLGWTYLDQNVSSKLDAVTFMGAVKSNGSPAYIHLEVVEKYLFNPSRYKYSEKTKKYSLYYNDPYELEGQVSQEVYIKTETKEDYIIKLVINGKSSFNEYQPVFFGMIKTFSFGNSLF